jgi:hypothetical protein
MRGRLREPAGRRSGRVVSAGTVTCQGTDGLRESVSWTSSSECQWQRLQYRPDILNGFITGTGLALDIPAGA